MYLSIPVFDLKTKQWDYQNFEEKKDWIFYLRSLFKEPGKYNLQETKEWIRPRLEYLATGAYCQFVKNSRPYKEFYKKEGIKAVRGIIFRGTCDYYVTGAYYFYLNYCPIVIKHENNKNTFPELWDSDYHIFLYFELAKESNLFSGVNKCRQKGFSYKIGAIITRDLWFKLGQSVKLWTKADDNMKSAWGVLQNNRTWLLQNTGWIRNFKKDDQKERDWHMMWKVNEGGKQTEKGRNNRLRGVLTSKESTALVGGYNTLAVGDEVGVNPNLLEQITYLEPSIKAGGLLTGNLIIGGSVGELKDCEDLRKITYSPQEYGFLGTPDIFDPSQNRLPFIATQWNYIDYLLDSDGETIIGKVKYYDENGNSFIEKALERIELTRADKKKQDAQSYLRYCSQNPINLDEMYQMRETNIFPIPKLNKQFLWLEANYRPETFELIYGSNGDIEAKQIVKPIVTDFPLRGESYREGAICIHEHPVSTKPFIYYAGIDPVKNLIGKGESLMSCHIYQSVYQDGNEMKGGKIVAWYTGRYHDDEDTFDEVLKLCKYYNARMAIESDEGAFIEWLKGKGEKNRMMKRHEFPFLKDLVPNSGIGDEYGIKMNTGGNQSRVKNFIFSSSIQYLEEVLGEREFGNTKVKYYGVEQIKDQMAIKEMLNYGKGNFDRVISLCLAIATGRAYEASKIMQKINKQPDKEPEKVVIPSIGQMSYSNFFKNRF